MKRLIGCLAALATVACALAQAPFTIVRPADGAKVRETVHVLFPKNSVPTGGYVGIFVNGKFVEAVVPSAGAKFLDYPLNTKTMELPDGPTTIEAVLYMDFAEKPRIVDRSSVQVTIANKASIPIPANGFLLRYNYQAGHQWVYHWDSNVTVSTISEAQAKMGGHAAETPVEDYMGRLFYSIDNTYGGGDALMRIQMEPPAGKNSLILALANEPTPKRVYEFELYPVYMKVSGTGNELFGLIPSYFGFNGVEQSASPVDVLTAEALPTLPTKPVKPGDSWSTRFQLPSQDNGNRGLVQQKNSLVEKLPARGEFVGVEWEMGYPCAKIHHTFALGSGGVGEGANKIQSNAQSVDETFWFALDRGVVVKLIRTVIIDKKLENQAAPTTNFGGPQGPGMTGPGNEKDGPGGPSMGSQYTTPQLAPGRRGAGGFGGRAGGAFGPPGGLPGGNPGNNFPSGQYSQINNNVNTNQLYRVQETEVLTLEH